VVSFCPGCVFPSFWVFFSVVFSFPWWCSLFPSFWGVFLVGFSFPWWCLPFFLGFLVAFSFGWVCFPPPFFLSFVLFGCVASFFGGVVRAVCDFAAVLSRYLRAVLLLLFWVLSCCLLLLCDLAFDIDSLSLFCVRVFGVLPSFRCILLVAKICEIVNPINQN